MVDVESHNKLFWKANGVVNAAYGLGSHFANWHTLLRAVRDLGTCLDELREEHEEKREGLLRELRNEDDF